MEAADVVPVRFCGRTGREGLQGKIVLVPMDLADRPAWYKKVCQQNQIPCLEHDNKIIGESLDLIKYMDINFEGPKLFPDDSKKQRLAEELLAYSDTFNQAMLCLADLQRQCDG
ncbi:hypothetical protein ACQ4PT_006568 [Festuca glaucescens]